MAYGWAGYVGLAKEASWGSGVAPTDFVEALSEDLSLTIERFQHKNIIYSLGEPDDTPGLRRIGGTVRVPAHPVSIGHFLRGVLNTKSVTSILSGFLYTHDFFTTVADFDANTPLQPYTFDIFRDVTSSIRYTGCLVDNLTLTFANGAAVMADARLLGRGQAVTQKAAAVTFPGSPLKPFAFDTLSLSIFGAGTADIETLTVEVANALTGFGALNLSTDIAKVRRTDHQMVNLRGTFDFRNVDDYLRFVNQTEGRLTISATVPSSFQLIVDLPRVIYTAFPLGIPGKERITVDFVGKGFVHQGSGTAIKVSLTTTTGSAGY